MQPSEAESHVKRMLRWSPEVPIDWPQVLGAAIGMAGPVLLAGAVGHLSAGLAASVGSLLLGTRGGSPGLRHRVVGGLVPAGAAVLAAWLITGHGLLSDIALALLAGAAAIIGGFSRPLAIAGTRFVLFLVIVATVAGPVADRPAVPLLIVAGAGWTVLVTVLLANLFGRVQPANGTEPVTVRAATLMQRFTRWKRWLVQPTGWRFATRLTVSLAIAGLLRWLWPEHHLQWIALTVALLSERQPVAVSVKTTQRMAGVAIGVVLAGALLARNPPLWALGAALAVLAGARPILRGHNYLAYSVITTPMIVLILDAGHPVGESVLVDRLVATLIGAGLVILANLAFRWMRASAPVQ